jgi:hypothetical protein
MASVTIPALSGVAPNFNVQALINRSLTTAAATAATAAATAATTTTTTTAASNVTNAAAARTATSPLATTATQSAATRAASATIAAAFAAAATPTAPTTATAAATPATTTTTATTTAAITSSQAPPASVTPIGGGQSPATSTLQALLGNLLVSSILAPQGQVNGATIVGRPAPVNEDVAATSATSAPSALLSNPEDKPQLAEAQANLGGGVFNRPPDQQIRAAVWQMVSQMFELP